MKQLARILMHCSIATIVALVALFWSGDVQLSEQSGFVSTAEARVGRPMTPMSYAGVARRTTRRAVAAGAVVGVGAAAGAAYAYCRQVVNSYGQVVRVCP